MIWQRVRIALLASMVAMAAALPVAPGKAFAESVAPDSGPAAPAPVVSSGPAMRTIRVTECVPENYTTTRTVYRQQRCEEKYTAYRIEHVPETRCRKVTVYDRVPCEETRTRTVCVSVPCVEERCCTEKHWVCKEVTTYKRRCVDNGHWECKCVECNKHKCRKSCDSCNPCGCDTCPQYKTVRVWVPCKQVIEEPCTRTVKCPEYRQVKKQVTVCRKETRCEQYKVTVCKCVPREKEETYTVCVEKRIPFEATRCVCKCVPVQEQVTCCRMVKRCVEKQVPVCEPSCCPEPSCGGHKWRKSGCCN
jgi:hypothetical protein